MQQLKDNYINYLKDAMVLNKVQMKDYGGMFGIEATDDIKSGELLLRVSHNYSISAFTVFQDQACVEIMKKNPHIYPTLTQIGNKKSDFQTLILYLIIQKNGILKPIFDLSPNPTCLLDCDIEIPFEYLIGLKKEFEEEYKSAKDEIMDIGLDSDLYDWAYRYCMNRRLSVNNDYPFSFLVPMIDMINHGKNKAIFGLEQENYKQDEYVQNNQTKHKYISQNKYWFSQEDQELIETLKVNESQRCTKILNKLLAKLFEELLHSGEPEIWETKLMIPDDSEDEDEPITHEQPSQIQINDKETKIQAQVNDDYLRDYYEQSLDESDHDWYTDIQQQNIEQHKCPAFLTARAVDDIEKGEQVLNLYGCLGNEHLLMYYGFALAKNRYDRVKFRVYMDCNTRVDFFTNIEKLTHLYYVPYKDLLKQNTRNIHLNQLTSEFKLKKSQFNMDLMRFLRTYSSLLDGDESVHDDVMIVLYRRITVTLLKKIQTPVIESQSYWGDQLRSYQQSKIRILKSHLEMIDNLNTKPEKMGIKVFMRLRNYLVKQK